MSHAIRVHETGGPDVLRWEEAPLIPLAPNEVLVRQTAVAINYIDTYHRSGLYPLPCLPHGIGVEAAGVVETVGAKVSGLKIGDRVAYAGGSPGAYADIRHVPADLLVPLPNSISDETAAACLLKGMTVEYLVRRVFPVGRGQTVLLHAAAGGVGLIACQWLRKIGARIIGTVSSEEKADIARRHGLDHPIIYTRENFVARVRELTEGKGVPVVFDSVGKATFEGSLDCLQPRGMYVGFGNASGKPAPFDMAILAQKGSLFLTRPTLFHYTANREELLESARTLFKMIESNAITVEVHQRWPLKDARDAHRALEARTTHGSSLLIPENT